MKRGAVIPLGIDTFEASGGSLIQNEDLSPDRSVLSCDHCFTVQFDETGGLFDKPIHFGCGNVMIRGDSNKKSLAAAFLGEKNLSRGQIRMHGDGMGAFKVIYRHPESFIDWMTLLIILVDDQWNYFGIRGDIFMNPIPGKLEFTFQIQIVIDISIQTGMDDGIVFRWIFDSPVVNRMAIGFCDRPN